ncbi:MAG: trypsin-like serine protease, partial [Proteobacteria bacterium]|nr:trypsin-like serine protease [Pseudomonadota bacterium]
MVHRSFLLSDRDHTLAAAGTAAFLVFSIAAGAAEPRSPRLPDLAAYGCAKIAATTPAEVVHKGQVIGGKYHEWHELYLDAKGVRQLACISLIAPRAEQLSAAAAKDFLNASLGLGAPSTARARAQGDDVQQIDEPDNVRPEPLRRALPDDAAKSAPEHGAEAAPEAPPLPASKEADPAGITPITRERPSILRPAFDMEAPATIGVDDRQRIADTRTAPWNTIGYLSVTYPNGQSFRCTATLISPYVVLTAGHCVHNKNRGGYASQVRFYPAQYQNQVGDNQPIRPYGKSDFAFIRVTEAWTQMSDQDTYPITDYRHDFAAVQFQTPFTFTD